MSIRKDIKSPIQPCWILDYIDENGIRRRSRVHGSKMEAKLEYFGILSEVKNIKAGLSCPSIMLKDLIKMYLHVSERNGHAYSTVKRIKNSTDSFSRITGETKWVSEISNRNVEYFKQTRSQERTPNKTIIKPISVNTELKHVKAMFNWAYIMGYIQKSPFLGVNFIKVKYKPIRFLSEEEGQALYDIVNDLDDRDANDLITFYLQMGARRSEILPPKFTWSNVDFHQKQIILIGKKGKRRILPLNQITNNILTSRKHEDYPFEFTPDQVTRIIKRFFQKANISNASVHTLRKTCGALLVQKGMDIFRVSKWLGHSTVVVTEQHYVDLLPSAYKDVSKVLDNIGSNMMKRAKK